MSDRKISRNPHPVEGKDKVRRACVTAHLTMTEVKNGLLVCPHFEEDAKLHYISHYVVQREKCPETGRLHFQGYFEFKYPVGLTALRKILPNGFWMHRKGNAEQAENYCLKEESRDIDSIDQTGSLVDAGPWIWGTPAKERQGNRKDIHTLCKLLSQGKPLHEIAEKMPEVILKYPRGFDKLREIMQPREYKRRLVKCTVRWGISRTGKTRSCYEENPDLYRLASTDGAWWNGYDGQSAILIDEFDGEIPIKKLLQFLDDHPMQVPTKGGFVRAEWTKVYITSQNPPESWYKNITKDTKDALFNRLTNIEEFKVAVPAKGNIDNGMSKIPENKEVPDDTKSVASDTMSEVTESEETDPVMLALAEKTATAAAELEEDPYDILEI